MQAMFKGVKRFVREEDGAAGVEYALLLVMVALVLALVTPTVRGAVQGIWDQITTALGG